MAWGSKSQKRPKKDKRPKKKSYIMSKFKGS